jgi:uncharacterized SAM-binding protein YcdF (DUF218 family)
MRKRLGKVVLVLIAVILLILIVTGVRIFRYGSVAVDTQADAAVVLGAAVWSQNVSPVFRERINHAVDLYRQGKVRKLIFTGGQGNSNEPTEAVAASRYAQANGIPIQDILVEQKSHTTFENIVYAKRLADANNLKTVLIVSDPMHMKRAMTMARDIGLIAYPSPTPTTRYVGWKTQLSELVRETFYYLGYLIAR